MTTNTKKILVAVLLCVVFCVTLFLGVFSFIPDFQVGEYEIYHSPSSLIKMGDKFTDIKKATYTYDLEDDVEIENVLNAINVRLQRAFGYYGVNVSVDKDSEKISIALPNNGSIATLEDKEGFDSKRDNSAKEILDSVIANGKIEVLTSSTYSESSVVLSPEHFKRAKVRTEVQSSNTFYICEVRLTSEGATIADSKLTSGTTYYYALDGKIEHAVTYTSGGTLYLYSHDTEEANVLAGYIKSGTLGATLTLDDTEDVLNTLGWIYLLVFGLVVLASFVFFVVRYKWLGVVPTVMQLLAVVIYVLFAGLAYTEIFNIAAAIGTFVVYAFMSFFTYFTFEKIRASMLENKSYTWSRHTAFKSTDIISLIAHGALLVLGIILWVIPTVVTAPLGCVFVYGAVLSFVVTFGLNRLFTLLVSPYFEVTRKAKARK